MNCLVDNAFDIVLDRQGKITCHYVATDPQLAKFWTSVKTNMPFGVMNSAYDVIQINANMMTTSEFVSAFVNQLTDDQLNKNICTLGIASKRASTMEKGLALHTDTNMRKTIRSTPLRGASLPFACLPAKRVKTIFQFFPARMKLNSSTTMNVGSESAAPQQPSSSSSPPLQEPSAGVPPPPVGASRILQDLNWVFNAQFVDLESAKEGLKNEINKNGLTAVVALTSSPELSSATKIFIKSQTEEYVRDSA